MDETLVVLDASAVVTLLIDPSDAGEEIARLLRDAALLAPAVMPVEVANVLRRRRNGGLLSAAKAQLAHHALLDLPVDLWHWEEVAERAWSLGDNLSSYDAAYVALAESHDALLVTRDARLANAPGITCRVRLVRDERDPLGTA